MKTRSIIVGVLIISLLLAFGIGFMVGTQSERRINIEQQEQMCINSLLSAENWFESWKKTQNETAVSGFCYTIFQGAIQKISFPQNDLWEGLEL